MDTPLTTSLIVSGIGMLLLFLALLFLCGLMYLMTAFIKDRPTLAPITLEKEEAATSKEIEEERLRRQRAAAIAVALARAEQALSAARLPSLPTLRGAEWQTFHRQRQLMLKFRTRKTR